RFLVHLGFAATPLGTLACSIVLIAIAICTNLVGVAFTGLEHNAHVAIMAAIVYGLVLLFDTGRLPPWLPPAIFLAPLLRYEALSVSLAALAILALRGHWRTAFAVFAIIVTTVGGFSLYLQHLGLSALPSSVLTKSVLMAGAVGGSASGGAGNGS